MMTSWRYTRRKTASGPRTRVKVRRLSDGREQVRKVGVRNYTDKGAIHAGYKHTHRKGYYNATEGANQPSHRLKGYRKLRPKKYTKSLHGLVWHRSPKTHRYIRRTFPSGMF